MRLNVANSGKGKDDFFRVYSNLPMDVRKEIILVVGDKPITWNVAYDEISNDTVLGKTILAKIIGWGFV